MLLYVRPSNEVTEGPPGDDKWFLSYYSLTSRPTVSHVVTPFMGLSINWEKA
jgi:hypothetical protein